MMFTVGTVRDTHDPTTVRPEYVRLSLVDRNREATPTAEDALAPQSITVTPEPAPDRIKGRIATAPQLEAL